MMDKAWTDKAWTTAKEQMAKALGDKALMDKYDIKVAEHIGGGSYADVYKVREKNTNKTVAVKKIHLKNTSQGIPSNAAREISVLTERDHENIVRDLKPQNLLIDKETNTLKVADFGLARTFDIPVKPLTPTVVTFIYKGPELLLGAPTYSTPVDMWSIGCIFAEMVNGCPLFEGEMGLIPLLSRIFETIGTPTENTWPGVTSLLISKEAHRIPNFPPKDLATVVPGLENAGRDLLQKMLYLDPSKRISAKDALEHEYFKDI